MKKYSYRRNELNKQIEKRVNKIKKFEWKHRNLIFLIVSFVIAYYILKFKPIASFMDGMMNELSYFGYVAAFVLGMLFTYALTATPAAAVLYNLGQNLNPLLIAFVGAFGSLISDYLIFRFVRDRLINEIKSLSKEIEKLTKPASSLDFTREIRIILWKKISRSRTWKIIIPIIAGFIIASPLPDEIGVAIFGAVKFEPKKFLVISYFLNFIGILAITSLSRIL